MLRNQKGMSLMEIMIVLLILGSISGILITTVNSRLKTARVREAKILIAEVSKALDMFYTDCGTYPTTDQGLQALLQSPGESCPDWGPEPYIKKMPKDPWNHELVYEESGGSYSVTSLGGDGKEGGADTNKDISSEDL